MSDLVQDNLRKTLVIDLGAFAQDFADFIATRERRRPPRLDLEVVPDEQWNQLLAVTAPYRKDAGTVDGRIGLAYAIKQPITRNEIPDLVKILFPELGAAMQNSDVIVLLNEKTLTHPNESDPEQAFNSIFNHLIRLSEKALEMQGYSNLNPIADSLSFMNHYSAARYIVSK
jgi:hypothetical protein